MNLVTRFLAARRDKLLMKLGCWLVIFSLVLGLMLPQQRAEALVAELTIGSVAALAASYLCACGLPLVTQGMDRDALVSNVQRLIQEFLDTELGGITIQDWLGNVWNVAVLAGKLIMGRPLTEEFVSFAQWVAGKYAIQAGENVVYSEYGFQLADGSYFPLYYFDKSTRIIFSVGMPLSVPHILELSNGFKVGVDLDGSSASYVWNLPSKTSKSFLSSFVSAGMGVSSSATWSIGTFFQDGNRGYALGEIYGTKFSPSIYFDIPGEYEVFNVYPIVTSDSSLAIDRSESMSYIPEGIEAEQGIALDVGAAATMDLDIVLQGVLDDVLAGELTATMEAAGEAVVDPPAEEIPDVDNLGLPALGAALTSRFPFSIPWDFFRAIKLLAAPAKAPYFEVDFMEPLADDVGGWQGDTTVILDFSEYAIIGQISRWTSTIGFCLMLAGATKRLIWTA